MNAVSSGAPAIPWYRSAVTVGAVVTIGSGLLSIFAPKLSTSVGFQDPAQQASFSATVFQVLTIVSGIWIAYARKKSPLQPITLTQAAADAHPNNQP